MEFTKYLSLSLEFLWILFQKNCRVTEMQPDEYGIESQVTVLRPGTLVLCYIMFCIFNKVVLILLVCN